MAQNMERVLDDSSELQLFLSCVADRFTRDDFTKFALEKLQLDHTFLQNVWEEERSVYQYNLIALMKWSRETGATKLLLQSLIDQYHEESKKPVSIIGSVIYVLI